MYQSAAKIEKDKSRLAQIYHNMGVLLMANKDYENADLIKKQLLDKGIVVLDGRSGTDWDVNIVKEN